MKLLRSCRSCCSSAVFPVTTEELQGSIKAVPPCTLNVASTFLDLRGKRTSQGELAWVSM